MLFSTEQQPGNLKNMDNEEKEGPAHTAPNPRPTLSGCGNYWLFLCVHSHESMLLQWWQTPPGLSTNAAKTDKKKPHCITMSNLTA